MTAADWPPACQRAPTRGGWCCPLRQCCTRTQWRAKAQRTWEPQRRGCPTHTKTRAEDREGGELGPMARRQHNPTSRPLLRHDGNPSSKHRPVQGDKEISLAAKSREEQRRMDKPKSNIDLFSLGLRCASRRDSRFDGLLFGKLKKRAQREGN